MGFFATFWSWLNQQLATYVGANTARLAGVLEPAVVTVATLYVMGWGYLSLTGKIDEPILAGLKRIGLLALVLGCGLRLWLYNTVVVDTFYTAPAELAGALVGATDPVGTVDAIWDRGGTVAGYLWDKGSYLPSGWGFDLAAAAVWCLVGALCVYTMFLIALSSVALALLLALGPLFIVMLLFQTTRRLFVAWLAQLTNYALVTVLTVMVNSLMLQVMQSYAAQTAALGSAIATVDALNMLLMAGLVLLILRQIMPIAAALAGGVALTSFGTVSRAAALGWRGATALSGSPPARFAMRYGGGHAARAIGRLAGGRAAADRVMPERAPPGDDHGDS